MNAKEILAPPSALHELSHLIFIIIYVSVLLLPHFMDKESEAQ